MRIEFAGSWALSFWESEYQDLEVTGNTIKVTKADCVRTIRIQALNEQGAHNNNNLGEKKTYCYYKDGA